MASDALVIEGLSNVNVSCLVLHPDDHNQLLIGRSGASKRDEVVGSCKLSDLKFDAIELSEFADLPTDTLRGLLFLDDTQFAFFTDSSLLILKNFKTISTSKYAFSRRKHAGF